MNKIVFRFFSFAVGWSFAGCINRPAPREVTPPLKISDGVIMRTNPQAAFWSRLASGGVTSVPSGTHPILEVGIVLAAKSTSRVPAKWIFLEDSDAHTSAVNKTSENQNVLIESRVSDELLAEISVGSSVDLYRYGLKSIESRGTVVEVKKRAAPKLSHVLISAAMGQPWVVGTTCQVGIAKVQVPIWKIPRASLIVLGADEYVLRIEGDRLVPVHVTVLSEEADGTIVSGALARGQEVITEGVILLKPTVETILNAANKSTLGKL